MPVLDTYGRTYNFRISIAGTSYIECNKVSGLGATRGIIEHEDIHGDQEPLMGTRKLVHLEFHDLGGPAAAMFKAWYWLQHPPHLTGYVTVLMQLDIPREIYIYEKMLPEAITPDDLDRETESEHGVTYRVACVLRKII